MMPEEARSLERITVRDLTQLARIAAADRKAFFAQQPKCAKLAERVVCVALCQGAALHFIDGRNGVKDFDVWTFYAGLSGLTFPPRRIVSRDFGFAKFGRSPGWPHFKGRRVDLLGRSINARKTSDPAAFLRRYLSRRKTESARLLARKAVVLLEPEDRRGEIIWPGSPARS